MYQKTLELLNDYAVKKSEDIKNSRGQYLTASGLAGLYVGLGIMLIITIGGILYAAHSPVTKIVMGACFGVALSLVIMSGSELFTGNTFVMTTAALSKRVSWKSALDVWVSSYIGNFIGSIILAVLFVMTDLTDGVAGEFLIKTAKGKMGGTFIPLFFKGILCNILVCLAVLSSVKLKSEAGKLIMIFWCLFAFITSGYEHSVANMTIFSAALMIDHPDYISFAGMWNNLIPVTLGNFVGGAVVLGLSYFYLGQNKR